MPRDEVDWISTREASRQLGITVRTLYRLIDGGEIAAYRFGRVIRMKQPDIDDYVERARIAPGDLEHLYAMGGDEVDDPDAIAPEGSTQPEAERR